MEKEQKIHKMKHFPTNAEMTMLINDGDLKWKNENQITHKKAEFVNIEIDVIGSKICSDNKVENSYNIINNNDNNNIHNNDNNNNNDNINNKNNINDNNNINNNYNNNNIDNNDNNNEINVENPFVWSSILALTVVKKASKEAFIKHGRSLGAPNIIFELNNALTAVEEDTAIVG